MTVWQRAWIVNCQAVGDGRQSLRYLAPYVFRVAIGNHRIRRVELNDDGSGKMTFMVEPSKQRTYRPMQVTAEEFTVTVTLNMTYTLFELSDKTRFQATHSVEAIP